jgi:hypothetical protein
MSYLTYALLTEDVNFGRRSRACINQRSATHVEDSNQAIATLAIDLLKMEPSQTSVMLNAICAGPDFDTIIDNGDGTIDSTKISDDMIMAHTHDMFEVVAQIFYPDLMPPPGTPQVSDVSPTSGVQSTPITITGEFLTGATLVNIGNDCTNLVVVSDTQLTAVTSNPKPSKGFYPVLVTVGGTVYSGPNFQVT